MNWGSNGSICMMYLCGNDAFLTVCFTHVEPEAFPHHKNAVCERTHSLMPLLKLHSSSFNALLFIEMEETNCTLTAKGHSNLTSVQMAHRMHNGPRPQQCWQSAGGAFHMIQVIVQTSILTCRETKAPIDG